MQISPMTDADRAERKKIMGYAVRLKDEGICPTCQNFETNDVYPSIESQVFHQDDQIICFLETYPRNLGHTIILVKSHYEDISEMHLALGYQVFQVIDRSIATIKSFLGAEKVYVCTMCDGKRNHLHFQLIPRYEEDTVRGSKLFVKERHKLEDCADTITLLRIKITELNHH